MNKSLEQLPEELIDGFESEYIKRGRFKPYGIYVTTDRIIGIRDGGLKRRIGISLLSMIFFLSIISVGNLFGLGSIFILSLVIGGSIGIRFILRRLFSKKVSESKKTITVLEEKKDFEVYKNDLQEIKLRKSRRLFAGPRKDFIIRSAKNEYTINVYKEVTVARLMDMFIKFGRAPIHS